MSHEQRRRMTPLRWPEIIAEARAGDPVEVYRRYVGRRTADGGSGTQRAVIVTVYSFTTRLGLDKWGFTEQLKAAGFNNHVAGCVAPQEDFTVEQINAYLSNREIASRSLPTFARAIQGLRELENQRLAALHTAGFVPVPDMVVHRREPKIYTCAAEGCENTFERRGDSKRKYCDNPACPYQNAKRQLRCEHCGTEFTSNATHVAEILSDPDRYFANASARAWIAAKADIDADLAERAQQRLNHHQTRPAYSPSWLPATTDPARQH